MTSSVWPLSVRISLVVRASQSLAVLSWLPVRTRRPSGEKQTDVTAAVCPASSPISAPVVASQMRAVLSSLPLTILLPSRLNAARVTALCDP